MLRDLPPCAFCSSRDYEPVEGKLEGSVALSRLRCTCQRDVFALSYSDGTRLYARYVFWLRDDSEPQFTQWLHDAMMPTLRSWGEKCLEAHRSARIAMLTKLRMRFDFWTDDRGAVRWSDLSEPVRVHIDDWENDYIRPLELIDSPLTPRIPSCVRGVRRTYYPEGEKWTTIVHDEVADLPVPDDPPIVHNAEFWKHVFDAVGIEHYVPTENRYTTDGPPWFAFLHGDATYLVGRRKHVMSLQTIHADTVDVTPLGRVAREDKVTFQVTDGVGFSGGQEIEIHASTREKCVEYLKIMLALEHVNINQP